MDVIVGIFPDNLFGPMVEADMLPVIVIAILSAPASWPPGSGARRWAHWWRI